MQVHESKSTLERARGLVPALAEHAAETEAARRVHPASLRGTGSHTLIADGAFVLAPVLGAALGARDATERLFASGSNRFGSAYDTIAQSPGARHLLTEATLLPSSASGATPPSAPATPSSTSS